MFIKDCKPNPPTPESPSSTILKMKSYDSLSMVEMAINELNGFVYTKDVAMVGALSSFYLAS